MYEGNLCIICKATTNQIAAIKMQWVCPILRQTTAQYTHTHVHICITKKEPKSRPKLLGVCFFNSIFFLSSYILFYIFFIQAFFSVLFFNHLPVKCSLDSIHFVEIMIDSIASTFSWHFSSKRREKKIDENSFRMNCFAWEFSWVSLDGVVSFYSVHASIWIRIKYSFDKGRRDKTKRTKREIAPPNENKNNGILIKI